MQDTDIKTLMYRLLKEIFIVSFILLGGLFINGVIPIFYFIYDIIWSLFENTIFNIRTHSILLIFFCVWCEFIIISIPVVLLLNGLMWSYIYIKRKIRTRKK